MNIENLRQEFEAIPENIRLLRAAKFQDCKYVALSLFDDSSRECAAQLNYGWLMFQSSALRAAEKLEGCVVVPSNSATLTCEQLLTVLQYGAPDLHVERTKYSEEQMETEMSIVWLEDGHGGKGYYAYYTELPEEGSIKLDLMEEAARGGKDGL